MPVEPMVSARKDNAEVEIRVHAGDGGGATTHVRFEAAAAQAPPLPLDVARHTVLLGGGAVQEQRDFSTGGFSTGREARSDAGQIRQQRCCRRWAQRFFFVFYPINEMDTKSPPLIFHLQKP